jgi:uncharacterized membrane protein (DUF2068 family)
MPELTKQSSSSEHAISLESQRPLSVTLFAVGTLMFSAVLMVGGFQAMRLSLHPVLYISSSFLVYMIARVTFFAIIGFISAWGLWRGTRWAPVFTQSAVALFILVYWIEWFLLIHPENRGSNSLFMFILSILVLLVTGYIFSRPDCRSYFGVFHDSRSKN